ncbi:hypothetical protein ACLB1G_14610 [Oxalobacteraceae bacterium A2-2]
MVYFQKLLSRLFYLLLMSLLLHSCAEHLPLSQADDIVAAEAYAKQAEIYFADGSFLDAIKLSRKGILLMEKNDITSGMVDDTEVKMNIANIEERKGNSRTAAGLLLTVLSSKLALAKSRESR